MKTLLLSTALACPLLHASILQFSGSPTATAVLDKIQIPIYGSALVNIPQEGAEYTPVYLTGSGRYTKQVGFISANVYYAQSFIDCPTGFADKEHPMNDIKERKTMAIHFTYVRNLSADQVRNAFDEMLTANGVDTADPHIAKSLNDLNFDISRGDMTKLVGLANGRRLEALYLEAPGGVTSNHSEDLAYQFWQVWFGVPVDSGMASLKHWLSGKGKRFTTTLSQNPFLGRNEPK
ncbi:MAG: hypothetical protein HYZ71_04695 [Deltaproteobacteria bacterium]|nr:hypothetical protein [Deltaproteobacteria bacterium]